MAISLAFSWSQMALLITENYTSHVINATTNDEERKGNNNMTQDFNMDNHLQQQR
jgi:hypothetical protein